MKRLKILLCRLLGHRKTPWKPIPDRFLAEQFDPSGIHWLHSHYRPNARWPVAVQMGWRSHYIAICDRCGEELWNFNPHPLNGTLYGKPDPYEMRVAALNFEHRYHGIDVWRVR